MSESSFQTITNKELRFLGFTRVKKKPISFLRYLVNFADNRCLIWLCRIMIEKKAAIYLNSLLTNRKDPSIRTIATININFFFLSSFLLYTTFFIFFMIFLFCLFSTLWVNCHIFIFSSGYFLCLRLYPEKIYKEQGKYSRIQFLLLNKYNYSHTSISWIRNRHNSATQIINYARAESNDNCR